MQKQTVSVEDFLKGFRPPLAQLAEGARSIILSAVPQASERVRLGWKLIGYNAPAYFAFISFERDHIRMARMPYTETSRSSEA